MVTHIKTDWKELVVWAIIGLSFLLIGLALVNGEIFGRPTGTNHWVFLVATAIIFATLYFFTHAVSEIDRNFVPDVNEEFIKCSASRQKYGLPFPETEVDTDSMQIIKQPNRIPIKTLIAPGRLAFVFFDEQSPNHYKRAIFWDAHKGKTVGDFAGDQLGASLKEQLETLVTITKNMGGSYPSFAPAPMIIKQIESGKENVKAPEPGGDLKNG